MTLRLSILICSIHSRAAMLRRLLERLAPQQGDSVDILVDCDSGESTIGNKRNRLADRSDPLCPYVAFVDDDDLPSPDYCGRLIAALESSPDCVGFKSNRYLDGKLVGDCSYSIRNKGEEDAIDYRENFRHFKRTPGHLTPIRRQHVIATPFQPWCYGEDRDFERRVFPLLKSEVFIDANLYDYLLVSREHRREKVHPGRWRPGRTIAGCKELAR